MQWRRGGLPGRIAGSPDGADEFHSRDEMPANRPCLAPARIIMNAPLRPRDNRDVASGRKCAALQHERGRRGEFQAVVKPSGSMFAETHDDRVAHV